MCGIAALQLRNPALHPNLGSMMYGMLCEIVERGPDSAGLALYGDHDLNPAGRSTVTILDAVLPVEELTARLTESIAVDLPQISISRMGETTIVAARSDTAALEAAIAQVLPDAEIAGRGEHVTVLKGTGHPLELAETYQLEQAHGTQGLSHTRMATESAVTAAGAHPFTVADDLCLVHNGSFSNHATIRRELRASGVTFSSDNDSEVAARYLAARLADGDDLPRALTNLGEVFDGFYTLVVTTPTAMAVVRDPIACKPAIIAETDDWVAMASEYRALAGLPGIESARIFEPAPGVVYTWDLAEQPSHAAVTTTGTAA